MDKLRKYLAAKRKKIVADRKAELNAQHNEIAKQYNLDIKSKRKAEANDNAMKKLAASINATMQKHPIHINEFPSQLINEQFHKVGGRTDIPHHEFMLSLNKCLEEFYIEASYLDYKHPKYRFDKY